MDMWITFMMGIYITPMATTWTSTLLRCQTPTRTPAPLNTNARVMTRITFTAQAVATKRFRTVTTSTTWWTVICITPTVTTVIITVP